VEILGNENDSQLVEKEWKFLPALSCSPVGYAVALAIVASESELGQVLLIGVLLGRTSPAVHTVDLATGVCTPQRSTSVNIGQFPQPSFGARLQDGRVVCMLENIGSAGMQVTPQVLGPPDPGSPNEASWQWRILPAMARYGSSGCVLSDGRFAVFGGLDYSIPTCVASCEALTLVGSDARWDPLPPMHQSRHEFVCAAIGGCVIVAGSRAGSEVYEEGLRRWRQLPCNIPNSSGTRWMGSALL
jgi:hypothetical protein